MNQMDALEESIDQVVCNLIESLQVDISHFSNKLNSYCKEAEGFLIGNGNAPKEARSALRPLTMMLFGVVVAVALLMNVGIVIAGATNSQMTICNIGIAVLYVLVGMCVMSDLDRGKTHFQDERQRLIEKLKRVAEQVRELVRERHHWTTEAARSKWATDNENLKCQLAMQQAASVHEKLELSNANLELSIADVEQKEKASSSLQEILTRQEVAKATLLSETNDLEERIAKGTATIEEIKHQQLRAQNELKESLIAQQLASEKMEHLQAEVASLESSFTSKTTSLDEIEKACLTGTLENARLHEERSAFLSSIAENETKLSQLEESLSFLDMEMNDKRIEGDALTAKLREDHAAIEFAIAEASLSQKGVLAEVDQYAADCETLQKKVAESQQRHIELINQVVQLESQIASSQESILLGETNLRSLEESVFSKQTQLEESEHECVDAERRLAQLLAQLAELECLSVVKLASDANEKAISSANAQEAIEIEGAQRAELEALRLELDERQLLIEESFQNSHKISREAEKSLSDAKRRAEMLTEKADSLAEQVEAKSTELYGHKQDLIAIRAEIRQLEAAKAAVAANVEELAALELRIESRHDELAVLEEQISESERRMASKQEHLVQLDSHCVLIQTALASLNVEFSDRSLGVNQLKTQCSELTNECSQLQEIKQVVNAQVEAARSKQLEIQDSNQEQETRHDSLVAEFVSLTQEYERLAESNRQLLDLNMEAELESERLARLKSLSEELEIQIELSNRQIDQLADEHDALVRAIEEQSASYESCSSRTREIQAELPELEIKLATTEVRQIDLEQELWQMSETLEAARVEKAEIESEKLTATRRVDELNLRASEIEQECSRSVVKLQKLSDEVAEAQGIVEQWTAYMATLQSDQKRREETIQSLEQNISRLQSQESVAADALMDSKVELEAAQFELQDVRAAHQRSELDLKAVQIELESTIQQREVESNRHAQIEFAIKELERQSMEVEAQLNSALNELTNVNEESTRSLQQRHEIEQTIEELQARLSSQGIQVEISQEASDSLVIANREAVAALDEARSEHANLQVRIANLEQVEFECKGHELDLKQLLQEISHRQIELGVIEQEVNLMEAKKKELAKIEIAYEESQANLSNCSNDCSQMQSRLNLLETEISQLDAKYADRKVALEQVEQLAQDKQFALRSAEKDLQSSLAEAAQLQMQIRINSDRLAEIAHKIASDTTQADEMEYHLEVLQRETGKLSSRRKAIEESIAVIMKNENDLSEKILATSKQHDESTVAAQLKIDQLMKTLQSLNESRDAAESDLQTKELSIRDLENEMDSMKQTIEDAKQEWNETKLAIRDSERKLDETRAATVASENELSAKKQASELMLGALEKRKLEIQASETLLASTKATFEKLQIEQANLEPEVTRLREKCAELEVNRKNASKAIEMLILEKEELQAQSKTLNVDLEKNESSTMEELDQPLSYFDSLEHSNTDSVENAVSFSPSPEVLSIEEDVLIAINSLKNVVPPPRALSAPRVDAWDSIFAGSSGRS